MGGGGETESIGREKLGVPGRTCHGFGSDEQLLSLASVTVTHCVILGRSLGSDAQTVIHNQPSPRAQAEKQVRGLAGMAR